MLDKMVSMALVAYKKLASPHLPSLPTPSDSHPHTSLSIPCCLLSLGLTHAVISPQYISLFSWTPTA